MLRMIEAMKRGKEGIRSEGGEHENEDEDDGPWGDVVNWATPMQEVRQRGFSYGTDDRELLQFTLFSSLRQVFFANKVRQHCTHSRLRTPCVVDQFNLPNKATFPSMMRRFRI